MFLCIFVFVYITISMCFEKMYYLFVHSKFESMYLYYSSYNRFSGVFSGFFWMTITAVLAYSIR